MTERLRALADRLRLHVLGNVVRSGTVTQLDLFLLGVAEILGRLEREPSNRSS
ncbi:hypothetical protein [Amycolatopsis sacchari]|uniref:hypothetical protein n=1 Tax=Amycolatopsis sacchari TaxID=115433 RepID=UPI003D71D465